MQESIFTVLEDAVGCILDEDIVATFSQPPFCRSSLDGYALRAEDTKGSSMVTPVRLKVVDKIMAGSVSDKKVEKGMALRLMTGAPIPEGADCVIMQEKTDYGEDIVSIYQELQAHDNICDAGEDYREGTLLFARGEKIDATAAGIIASAGIGQVQVYRKPKVALLTSGDELISPGTDSFRFFQSGAIGTCVFDGHKYSFTKSGSESIETLIEMFPEADIILMEGFKGSSYPKIIMHDSLNDAEPICQENHCIAVVSNGPVRSLLSVIDRNEIEKVADVIEAHFENRMGN